MSRDIVMAAQGPFQHAFGLLEQYIDVCPDAVWEEINGGWPVWQQIYHALTALDFFIRRESDEPQAFPLDPDAGRLARVCGETLPKAQMKALAAEAKARVEAYVAGLADGDLARKNEGLSGRMGMDMTHGATLGMLASHTLYHVGSCDAALRDHGIRGVF